MYTTRSFFFLLVFFLFGRSPFYTTWRSGSWLAAPLSAGVETHVCSSATRHSGAVDAWWPRGDVLLPICLVGCNRQGNGTKWNRNAKKSEKLERGWNVLCASVVCRCCGRNGVTALSLSCLLQHALFFGRYQDMICDGGFVAHHRHCRLGTSWCGGVQRNTFTVSQRWVHNHMNVSYHPAGFGHLRTLLLGARIAHTVGLVHLRYSYNNPALYVPDY